MNAYPELWSGAKAPELPVSTVQTKYVLHLIYFIENYHILNKQHCKIKSYFEKKNDNMKTYDMWI